MHKTIAVGDLRAVIGDNEAGEDDHRSHHAGYNGLWSLTSIHCPANVFVPLYAGLNLEHVFDACKFEGDAFFEPRRRPMKLEQTGPQQVSLHQQPLEIFGVESWTTFTLRAPHYLDFLFRCVPHRPAFAFGYMGVFWASYINLPESKSIRFLSGERARGGGGQWKEYCTQQHGLHSSVRHLDDDYELKHGADFPAGSLMINTSPLRYELPLFYGLYRPVDDLKQPAMLWLILFDLQQVHEQGALLRFAHSPSGGGASPDGSDTNPAWDFLILVPEPRLGQEYQLRACLVYKPYAGRADVKAEYDQWLRTRR